MYLARRAGPHGFQKLVAVKRILPQYAEDPDFVAMFVDEARVCARLAHPNIVHVFDFGDQDEELYMAMEFVEGSTVARLVRAAAQKDMEIPLEASLHIALSVLRGLEYAHGARDEAIQRRGLVAGAAHQRVVDRIHAGGAVAFQHEMVQRVEGVEILVGGNLLDLQA